MIIVKLQGGLGNQLFEYAYGRALSIRYKIPFKLDITNYDFANAPDNSPDKRFRRGYGIPHFNAVENIAAKKEIRPFQKYRKKDGRIWYLYNKLIANESIYLVERTFPFNEKYAYPKRLEASGSIYAEGFWQTEKYFKEIEQTIRDDLTLKNKPDEANAKMLERIEQTESVCLHVRRGNFLLPEFRKHHGICPLEYYKKAISIIEKNVPHPTFFVFSDDKEWVKKNIETNHELVFVDHNGPEKDYEDMRLMGACKHHIIANSSFSWWGAWLSKNKGKTVVYPSQIFKKKWDTSDFAPPEWVKIEIELQ